MYLFKYKKTNNWFYYINDYDFKFDKYFDLNHEKMMNKNEKGFALVLSLILLLVMSLMGGALIVISSGDHQSNNTSDQYQQAFYVAETGLLEGEKKIINQF